MTHLLKILIMALYRILPLSPFKGVADELGQFDFLPYLNWFIPFDRCFGFTVKWCAALALVYNFDLVKDIVNKIRKTFFS